MTFRLQILLLIFAPFVILAGFHMLGRDLPVPLLGRDYVIHLNLPTSDQPMPLPTIYGPEDSTKPLVVIDAGHGGHDPGALGLNLSEKTVVLGLARALRDQLLEDSDIRIALTREDDRFLALAERVEIARALDADLFISIHADSAGEQNDVRGASIYNLSGEASSEAAARFAARENQADQVNGVLLSEQDETVNAILVELSQRRSSQVSAGFAETVLREGQEDLRFHPDPLRSAALGVLRAPDVPSVLFEAGFITNVDEAQFLSSIEGQRAFAESVSRAIRIHFARQELETEQQAIGLDQSSTGEQ